MTIKHLAIAASALTLLAGAAHAQQVNKPMVPDPAPAPTSATNPVAPADPAAATGGAAAAGTTMAPAMDGMAAPSATAPGASSDASAVVSTTTVTNGPVADTPENRAKYGQPLSRAGKRTAAKGN
jgi:hypothetical protein